MQKSGLRSSLKDRQERTEAGLGKDLLSHQGNLSLPGAAASPSKNGEGSPPKQVMTSSAPREGMQYGREPCKPAFGMSLPPTPFHLLTRFC